MRIVKKQLLMPGAAFLLALLFCGCHANVYYQARAAERARQFLLKEARELTLEEQNFVRYNDPVLLHGDILGIVKTTVPTPSVTLQSEQRQICVAWHIPTRELLYLVYGTSNSRMAAWHPVRLIRRSYKKQSHEVQTLAQLARTYAQNNLFGRLTAVEINAIRFTFPWLIETDFELNCDPEGKMTEEEKTKLQAELAKQVQYSLVWKFPDKAVVFCGTSSRSLGGWQINFAGILSLEEVEKRTLHVWMTPQNALDPLPEELQAPKPKADELKPSVENNPVIPTQAPPAPAELKKKPSGSTEDSSVKTTQKLVVPEEDRAK